MRRESTLIYSNEGEGDQWGTVPPQWGIVTVGEGGGVNGEVFQ